MRACEGSASADRGSGRCEWGGDWGGSGQFYLALLSEVYVVLRGCVGIDGADEGCENVEMLNSRGGL